MVMNKSFEKNKYLNEIAYQMFKVIGKEKEFEAWDFKDQWWFKEYEWSVKTEKKYRKWLFKKLKKNKKFRENLMNIPSDNDRHINEFVTMFCFQFGWCLSEGVCNGK